MRGMGESRFGSSGWSRRWDSNPQPPVYKTGALPLSYAGERVQHWQIVNCKERNVAQIRDKRGGSPGTRTPNQLIKSQLLYH